MGKPKLAWDRMDTNVVSGETWYGSVPYRRFALYGIIPTGSGEYELIWFIRDQRLAEHISDIEALKALAEAHLDQFMKRYGFTVEGE